VDDIVVTTYGQTCTQTIKAFHAGYTHTHAWLREVGMSPNPDKEEILASTDTLRMAVVELCPSLTNKTKLVVRDLGVSMRTYRKRSYLRDQRLQRAAQLCRRIGRLPLQARMRHLLVESMVHPHALYGAEVDRPTNQQFQTLRRSVFMALYPRYTHRSRAASILLEARPLTDPFVYYAVRLLQCWRALFARGVFPDHPSLQILWTRGTYRVIPQGLIETVSHLVTRLGIVAHTPSE
jgi:hypothetical protein